MQELDYIDHFRIIMSPRKRFLDQIVKALEPMNNIVGKEEEREAILQREKPSYRVLKTFLKRFTTSIPRIST